jgi:hypothetical protein
MEALAILLTALALGLALLPKLGPPVYPNELGANSLAPRHNLLRVQPAGRAFDHVDYSGEDHGDKKSVG